jgi:uncharacterized membrane protein YdjX (TVP38/TMEM64 family)
MSEPAAIPTPQSGPAPRSGWLVKLAVGLGVLLALFLLARELGDQIPRFAAWVGSLGVWGPLVFVLGYAAAVVGLVPGSLLTLAGGAVFGLVKGSLYVFVGATLGSAGAFLVARHLARRAVEQRIARHQGFAAIDRAVGEQGLKIVLLLRLSPVFPFNLLNYGLGLTRVHFRDYLIASLGMIPGTVLYVYYGWVAGDVAALAGGATPEKSGFDYAIQALGLLATVAVTVVITRIARRTLAEATAERGNPG